LGRVKEGTRVAPAHDVVALHALIVEDEPDIARLVDHHLRAAGFTVELATTGADAVERATARVPDVILLDLMLPDFDGCTIARRLRAIEETRRVGILAMTARGSAEDRIEGLEAGVDDYVVKPFAMRELVLRVTAVAHRSRALPAGPRVLDVHGISLDLDACTVTAGAHTAALRPLEVRLLKELMSAPGRVFSRADLLRSVWNVHGPANERVVDVAVFRLREALGDHASALVTVLGAGYKLGART
jgi:two-component system phosphate regulon response regulator PhoB